MGLLSCFYPDATADSTYSINFERLYKKGFRGLIFDIDNTLVPHDAPADGRSIELFKRLHDIGFRCLLLSNNKESRVRSFQQGVKYTEYIYKANKPFKKGYLVAMEAMGTNRSNTLFIGDQIFTDTWGAKLAGIRTILVKPIDKHEEIQIVLKRIPEKLVMYFYEKARKK